jgi:hypothetical protein
MTVRDITSIFEGLVKSCHNYRASTAAMRELEAIDPDTRSHIASELGFSAADLDDIVSHGAGAEDLMARMIADFGLDADKLARDDRMLFRDIEVLCSKCTHKGRCFRELEAGTAAQHAKAFCPNAETFEALA